MDNDDFRAAREGFGFSLRQWAHLLGYLTIVGVYRMESGVRPVNVTAARLAQAYLDGYRPSDWPEKGTGRKRASS